MTTAPEPTNADLLAFMQTAFAQLTTEVAGVKADLNAQGRTLADLSAKTAFVEAGQNGVINAVAEHRGETRSSFQAVARDMARAMEAIAGVKADTAFVEGYVNDMHQAVQRHIADPGAHRDAA